MTETKLAPRGSKNGQAGREKNGAQGAEQPEPLKPSLTDQERKKVSQAMRIIGRVGGSTMTPKKRKALQKNMAIARKFRHKKAA